MIYIRSIGLVILGILDLIGGICIIFRVFLSSYLAAIFIIKGLWTMGVSWSYMSGVIFSILDTLTGVIIVLEMHGHFWSPFTYIGIFMILKGIYSLIGSL